MSQENVDLTGQAIDAFNRRDLEPFLALAHPEMEHVALAGEAYRGHDGLRRWWEDILGLFGEDISAEMLGVREFGDTVHATVRLQGRGPSSRIPVDQTVWMVIKWRSGKSFLWSSYHREEEEALKAVGLSE